jgi:predicted dehydrogenase
MEAMWTRFLPTVKEFKKVVEDGRLGDPVMMWADFLVDININSHFIYLFILFIYG